MFGPELQEPYQGSAGSILALRPLPVTLHTLSRSGRSASRAAGSKAKYAVCGVEPGAELATAMSRRAAAIAGDFQPQEQGVVKLTWALAAFGLEGRCCCAVPCFDRTLRVLRRPLIAEETVVRCLASLGRVLRRWWLQLICPGFSYVPRFCARARARRCVSQFLSSKPCG